MFTPPAGLAYHQILRAGRHGWGWGLLGAFTVAFGWLILVPLLLVVGLGSALTVAGASQPWQAANDLLDTTHLVPASLGVLNLILASGIPLVMLVMVGIHGLRPGWVMSVLGRVRWRWMLVSFGLAVVALMATVLVSLVIPSTGNDQVSGQVNDFTAQTAQFIVVILLLTPLQAAAEEYIFRGYLTQVCGVSGSKILAVLVPAFLFACAHAQSLEISGDVFLGQTYPIFIDRFAFGIVAGILVIATGGMEAGIAMHILNNFLAYGAALMFSDMSSALTPTGGSWWQLPITLTQSIVFTALVVGVGRLMGIQTRTPGPEPALVGASVLEAHNRLR